MRLAAAAAVVLGIAAAGTPLASSAPLTHNGAIAYDCSGGNNGICVINPDGSGRVQLTSSGAEPAWSPDGTKITYNDGGNIFVMNADGTHSTQLTGGGISGRPSFSANGSLIYFNNSALQIESVDPTAGLQTPVQAYPSVSGVDPVQSPDGSKLAFDMNFESPVSVYDGSTTVTLGTGERPAWAPDSSRVYFEHLDNSNWEIDSNTPAGTGFTTVLTGGKENVGVSPDGTELVIANAGGGGIQTSPIAPGSSATSVPNAGGGFDPAWQPVSTTYSPALSTQVSTAQAALGTTISDSATLTNAGPGAGGSITFQAFSTTDCSGLPVHSETVPVDGGGTYAAAGFTPSGAGQYTWTASYTGDAPTDTFGASEGCGGANEQTIVTAATVPVWTGSAVSTSEPGTATVVSDGTGSAPQFTYNVPNACSCGANGEWKFQTTASTGGQIALPWTYAGFNAYFEVTVGLQAYVIHNGVESDTSLVSAGPQDCCTSPSAGFSYSGTATLNVQPGDTYGFDMTGRNFDSNAVLQGTLTVGLGATNTSWPFAAQIPIDGSGNGTKTGSLDTSGQAGWYRFNVTPGESLDIDLTNLPANYDLTLFSDIGQAFDTLNTTSDLQQLSAEFAPSAFSPSAFSPSAFSPSAFSPSAFSPSAFSPSAFSPSAFSPSAFSPSAFSPSAFSPSAWSGFTDANGSYESAQTRSEIAVSSSDGTADEHIVANTWNNTGSFYIRVTGRNGAYDPGVPFTVNVHEDVNSCSTISQPDPAKALLTSAVDPTKKTLILADYARMPQGQALTNMQQKLQTFAGQVGGAIVDVSSQSPRADALLTQAQGNPGCVYAENLAAGTIRDIVTAYRSAPGSQLKYVVIVGNDHDIPFFRYPDASGLGTESNYVPPVGDNTPSQASLRLNYVLSQDAYGASTILHLNGLDLPVPDLPVGRLVETPDEISGMLDAYTAAYNRTTGIASVSPTSSLVTGYDFLAGAAHQVQTSFNAKFGASADSLIADQGTPTAQAWTADSLRTSLLGKPHGLIFLAGHFSANNTLAADFATTMNSTEIAASTTSFENSIVFSAGCHSGYNIANEDGISGVTQPLDWVEAFAQKQATVVAGTGYQYGDTDFVAYSAKLYATFAQNLTAGSVGVGAALVDAKQQYLEDTTQLSGIDVKSLLESTLYGLPMLDVTMPGVTPLSAAVQASAPTSVSPTPAAAGTPGGGLGLSSADESFPTTPPLSTEQHKTLTGATATYLQGPDGVVTAPGEPVLPLLSTDVTVPGQVLRGVGFLGGSFNDESGVIPLTGDPGTDQDGTHAPFASPTFFPEKPWAVNYFSGLARGSTATTLLLTPGQYKTDGPGTDLQRQFTSLNLRLFYSNNLSFRALAAPPSISRVDASSGPGGASFAVQVVGDPAAGIQDVWVTWRPLSGGGSTTWTSLDLSQGTADPTTWTGALPTVTAPIEFMVQAVNGVGLVTLDDNNGAFYRPNLIPAALQTAATATSLSLGSTTSAGYGSTPSLTATLAPKSGGGSVPDGETVTFTVGQATMTATTSGGSATVNLPLSLADLPGSGYHVDASFAGDSTYGPSSASKPFTITTLPTTLTLSGGGTVADGADTGIGATLTATSGGAALPQRTVEFVLKQGGTSIVQTRITDPNGVASLGVVPQGLSGTYTVSAFFGPGGPTPPTLPADAVYAPSTAATTASLTVSPVTITSIVRVPPTATNAATVSWTVTFSGSVGALGSSNFALVQVGVAGATFGSVASAGGNAYTVSATTGHGDGTIALSVTGVTDSAGGAVASLLNQAPFTIDKTPPTATITFPASGGAYNAAGFTTPCTTTTLIDVCGTVSDPDGPSSVKLSLSNGTKYLTASGFTSATETFLTATVTGSTWSYKLASLPPDGSYTLHVQTTDALGNTQAASTYAATAAFTIDTAPPTIVFAGNNGTYGLLDQVKITCTASAGSGSPLVTNPCTAFSINQPAWAFAPGKNTVPAPGLVATDKAGNSNAPATTSFTVTATTSTLCQLTTQFAEGSAKYAALTAAQKKVVNALATGLCTTLTAIVPKLSPAAKTLLVNAYKAGVQSLVTQGWLTSAQAATLTAYAATL